MSSRKILFLAIIPSLILICSLAQSGQVGKNKKSQSDKANSSAPADNPKYPVANRYGGALTVNLGGIVTLDSQKAVDENSLLIINNIQQGLYAFDEHGRLIPKLACDYPRMLNELTYTIDLRPGIRFHDGYELKATDMVYTFQRLMKPETQSPGRFLFDNIGAISAPDDLTLEIRLKKPDNMLGYLLARPELYPLSQKSVQLYGEHYGRINATGTGPFQLAEWQQGEQIILKRNPCYWEKGLPYLNTLNFQYHSDRQPGLEKLQKRLVSIAAFISPAQAKNLDPRIKLVSTPGLKIVQIYLNTHRPPFNNILVRQALAYGINRQNAADKAYGGYATPARSLSPPWHWVCKANFDPFPYSPQLAGELLQKSPYWLGRKLEFELVYPKDNPGLEQMAQFFRQQLAVVGFNVHLRSMPKPELLNFIYGRTKSRQTFAAALEEWQGPMHPDGFSYLLYNSSSPYNKVKYNNPLADQLFQLAHQAAADEDKATTYRQTEEIIAPDANTIYLCFPHYIFAYNTYVGGLKINPDGMADFGQVWTYK